jgi:hypothetical protein
MKHFVGPPRRPRIVTPHLALADYRAAVPLARRGGNIGPPGPPLSELLPAKNNKPSRLVGDEQGDEQRCRNPRGSLHSRKLVKVVRLGCGRWKCRPCARGKAAMVRDRFKRVLWVRQPAMVTLTAARIDEADPTPKAMAAFARRAASFRRWVARRYGKFQWAWVREIAPRKPLCVCHEMLACRCGAGGGRLHVHMLWDARYVPQAVLSAAAERAHLGPVLDVRRVSGARAARYVSKYLVKGAQHPAFLRGHARRFAMRAERAPRATSDWRYDPRTPAQIVLTEYGEEISCDTDRWEYPPGAG